jgi:hypothetical protein
MPRSSIFSHSVCVWDEFVRQVELIASLLLSSLSVSMPTAGKNENKKAVELGRKFNPQCLAFKQQVHLCVS